MKRILAFIASGFSTRMGGFPKGLAQVNDTCVILNAITLAQPFFDDIYIIANHTTRQQFETVVGAVFPQVKVRAIITGKGDAESVLKSAKLVLEESTESNIDFTFCWGDAFFISAEVFRLMTSVDFMPQESILVGCSVDENPYAYFDIHTVNGDFTMPVIEKSYFRKDDGNVDSGIHDQCIFRSSTSLLIQLLCSYGEHLGYDGETYTLSANGEMGLLRSFDYLAKIGRPARAKMMPTGMVRSFNTTTELQEIIASLPAGK